MLFPIVSVTLIGLIAGLLFAFFRKSRPTLALLLGVSGAWMGFITGAVLGVVVDVIAQTGVFLAIMGHLAAVLGAVVPLFLYRA